MWNPENSVVSDLHVKRRTVPCTSSPIHKERTEVADPSALGYDNFFFAATGCGKTWRKTAIGYHVSVPFALVAPERIGRLVKYFQCRTNIPELGSGLGDWRCPLEMLTGEGLDRYRWTSAGFAYLSNIEWLFWCLERHLLAWILSYPGLPQLLWLLPLWGSCCF